MRSAQLSYSVVSLLSSLIPAAGIVVFFTNANRTGGADVSVLVYGNHVIPNRLVINAGDRVTWTVEEAVSGSNAVAEVDGRWASPLIAFGGSFSMAFTNAGFSVYKIVNQETSFVPGIGTIQVAPWTNAPPVVSINSPVNGVFAQLGPVLQIAVSTERVVTDVQEIDLLVDNTVIASLSAPPFNFAWTNAPAGEHILVGREVDIDGKTNASAPVNITLLSGGHLFMPELLSDGRLVFYYSLPPGLQFYIGTSDSIPPSSIRWSAYEVGGEGVFLGNPLTNECSVFWFAQRSEIPPPP